jgi:plastocyanin
MKRLLSLASLLVLIGAGCAASTPASDTPAAGAPTPAVDAPVAAPVPTTKPAAKAPAAVTEERVVKFTKDGKFEPAHVAVHTGGKITWVNESNQSVWPASNPHPVHTDYTASAFDAKRALKPGESWTFTFAEAGVWSYHNHLQPGVQGDVQVTPKAP